MREHKMLLKDIYSINNNSSLRCHHEQFYQVKIKTKALRNFQLPFLYMQKIDGLS